MIYEYQVTGEPKGQPRPRAFARRMGAKFVARVYDSDVADEWKRQVRSATVAEAVRHKLQVEPERAFSVRLHFQFARPPSHLTSKGVLKAGTLFEFTRKPDLDNLAKAVLDAITDTNLVWRDDSQVTQLALSKAWTSGESGLLLRIESL